MTEPTSTPWVNLQLEDPEFRASYLREVVRLHHEAITTKNPELARWCMRERAVLDSSGSVR